LPTASRPRAKQGDSSRSSRLALGIGLLGAYNHYRLVPALENAPEAVGNRHVSSRVSDVIPRVRVGVELWKALEGTGIFTNLTIEMIKVGEASGALEEMLTSVSDFYDEEIDLLLGRVISFVEPAILVIMGGVVMTILLSVYLPIFKLMSQIKG